MFIRGDLLNEIKEIFYIDELNYIKTEKLSYNKNSLVFDAKGRIIAIEFEEENNYCIREISKDVKGSGCFAGLMPIVKLSSTEQETYLEFEGNTIKLPGKAFDFTVELDLAALEDR